MNDAGQTEPDAPTLVLPGGVHTRIHLWPSPRGTMLALATQHAWTCG